MEDEMEPVPARGVDLQAVRLDAHIAISDPSISHQLGGVGIGLLSQSVARTDVEQGWLIRLLPEWGPDSVELHAIYSTRLHSSPKVRAFLTFLREYVNDAQPHLLRVEAARASYARSKCWF